MDAELEILRELGVELAVILCILGKPIEQLQALLHDVLANHLQDFTLLEHLTGDVEWQILGINYALHEVEVLWDQLLAILHDEHPPHVQLDVILDLAVLKEVKRCPSWDEEQCTKLELAFNGEVLHSKMVFPVIGERLVELSILLICDVVWVAGPDGLCLVEFLKLSVFLLDLFRLLFLGVVFFVVFILILDIL